MYRKYDCKVPEFLHNRPNGMVKHIMKRMYPKYPSSFIQNCGHKLFMVNSETSKERYQVWLGSDSQLPSCQCMDYKINRLPCKHICAVVNLPGVGWQSLGASFNNYPLFKLDSVVVTNTSSAQSSNIQINNPEIDAKKNDVRKENDGSRENDARKDDDASDDAFIDQTENNDAATSPEQLQKKESVEYKGLKKRRQGLKGITRAKCIAKLKALNDELYIVQNTEVLAKLATIMQEALSYARANHPNENNIPLKDKTLSPRRAKKRKVNHLGDKTTPLPLHAKRRKKKRFGVGAENREKAADITITSNGSVKNKEKNVPKPCLIDLTNLMHEQSNDKQQEWLIVQGINLTSTLRDTLMSESGWLTDDHVDAAQRLLKSENATVGGLNDVVAMTHFKKKTRVDIAKADGRTIQCHNIGGHWVTSSSVHGMVTVYESLSTGLNKTLLEQLVHLYQIFCVEGQLTVTVVLQQLQKGFSDCGLFCIANATALAQGVNPTYVVWDQSKMREHLAECYKNNQMKMFPHHVNYLGKQTKVYKLRPLK